MLLGREEVYPDEPNDFGQTPLFYAAAWGNEEVVKLLLGREEVSPDYWDDYGRTPLLYAAQKGHGEVVEMLLERGDVNPDHPDNDGRTPLSHAAHECSKCERQGHNLFYLDNTAQVQGVLRGTL